MQIIKEYLELRKDLKHQIQNKHFMSRNCYLNDDDYFEDLNEIENLVFKLDNKLELYKKYNSVKIYNYFEGIYFIIKHFFKYAFMNDYVPSFILIILFITVVILLFLQIVSIFTL